MDAAQISWTPMHHRPGAEELLYGLDYLDFAWSSATKNRNGWNLLHLCSDVCRHQPSQPRFDSWFRLPGRNEVSRRASEETEIYDLTGMTIYGVGVLASIAVLITSMVASCICCCCEKSPGKGYTVSNVEYTEHRGDDYNSNYRATSTGVELGVLSYYYTTQRIQDIPALWLS
ncbi:hypothetical protein BSL78_02772 [Apostichopus japonicus]|uniref:Uncharacterized protein n=1 Tax=Stichopus japonicus TaxID=307972 RepID=A0A2G8LJ39_STIJA|nr:hypothetical protein BSL78_02772 [Apostichopus japonicus]